MASGGAPSVLAVADSDSYLKWSAATLAAMPAGWTRRQVVVRSPITPSAAQMRAATGGDVEVLGLARLLGLIERQRPDVLLLAATGPTVRTIAGQRRLRTTRHRPVLVTGLPGISLPATARAVEFRGGCDLLIVHSRRERRAFAELVEQLDCRSCRPARPPLRVRTVGTSCSRPRPGCLRSESSDGRCSRRWRGSSLPGLPWSSCGRAPVRNRPIARRSRCSCSGRN